MEKLESLKIQKFAPLTNDEMQMINGGGLWSKWEQEGKYIKTECGYKTIQRRYNWFGLHATSQTRTVDDKL